ncbi:MAG: N-acetylneuraminate synthase family protein [Magnetococcales bacterium]|nr:N-acetylneuraminate synthase family protein [Magnetococcales bacterium]
MRYDSVIQIAGRRISLADPVYFIADIASNHDGDLDQARELIRLAAEAGADAVKFQHFRAERIVSDFGFRHLGGQLSHQASWKKPVFEVYRHYECNREWSGQLAETAQACGVQFMTTPYDIEAVELLNPLLPAYKIGSGDITWSDFLRHVASQGKPVLLATGASTLEEVDRAVETILACNQSLVLMQCNTNYTGSLENFRHINLRVLSAYAVHYPGMLLGLSDHTPGHATVLGAVALGARVIEKHFTNDNSRIGPDHAFSMNPATWREMVERCRELEAALGDGRKRVEENEGQTVVVQRRCLRLTRDMAVGERLSASDLEALRPAPSDALEPFRLSEVVGRPLRIARQAGDALRADDVE